MVFIYVKWDTCLLSVFTRCSWSSLNRHRKTFIKHQNFVWLFIESLDNKMPAHLFVIFDTSGFYDSYSENIVSNITGLKQADVLLIYHEVQWEYEAFSVCNKSSVILLGFESVFTTGPRLPVFMCSRSGWGPIGPMSPLGPWGPDGPRSPFSPRSPKTWWISFNNII